ETLERFHDVIVASCPMGRIGEPADMAGVAIWLAPKAGADVTRAVIPPAGGGSTRHRRPAAAPGRQPPPLPPPPGPPPGGAGAGRGGRAPMPSASRPWWGVVRPLSLIVRATLRRAGMLE